MDNQQGPTVQHRELCSVLYGSPGGRELGGEWIHVYVWLSPFAVYLKLSHCQSGTPHYKIKNQVLRISIINIYICLHPELFIWYIHPSTHPTFYLSDIFIYLSIIYLRVIYLPTYLPACLSIYLPSYPAIYPPIHYLSTYYLSITYMSIIYLLELFSSE